jgi:hypothetical protein
VNRFTIWLSLVVGMASYRVFGNATSSIDESIAGTYYSGLALIAHWLFNGGWGEMDK